MICQNRIAGALFHDVGASGARLLTKVGSVFKPLWPDLFRCLGQRTNKWPKTAPSRPRSTKRTPNGPNGAQQKPNIAFTCLIRTRRSFKHTSTRLKSCQFRNPIRTTIRHFGARTSINKRPDDTHRSKTASRCRLRPSWADLNKNMLNI